MPCRLTSDIAFIRDPAFKALVEEYAADITSLEFDFARSWYRLVSQVCSLSPVVAHTF